MDSFLYGIFAILYMLLIVWLLQRSEPHFVWSNVLYVILLALLYDNGIIALGSLLGESDMLYFLNYMRFVLYAFVTPLFVLYSVAMLREAHVNDAMPVYVFLLACMYTLALIVMEACMSIYGLSLRPLVEGGALRYEAIQVQPPVMLLFVTLVMLLCSICIWLKRGWIWFFIGVVVMAIGSMLTLTSVSNVMTNAVELFFLTMLVWTKRFVRTAHQ